MTAPLSAIGTRLELFGNPPRAGYATWGIATWGNAASLWWGPVWNDIACEVDSFSTAWGSDDQLGVLTQSAAGSVELSTYDPDGLLDPANDASSVDIGMRQSGTPLRIRAAAALGSWVVETGYVDELSWDAASGTGRISGSDAIAQLAMATTTERFALPNPGTFTPPSLYALVAAIIADTGLPLALGTVAGDGWPADPQVAFPAKGGQGVNAWTAIKAASIDALALAWVDRFGTLRFAPLGGLYGELLNGVGSFEGYQSGTLPPGWTGTGNSWTGPSGNAVDGGNILRVSGDGTTTNPNATSPLIPVVPGALYTITCWGARMGGALTARLYVDIPGVSSTIVLNWTTGTSSMAKLTATWQCPADGSVTAIKLRWTIPALAATGDIWYFDAATMLGAESPSSGITLGDGGIALADLTTTRTARGVYNVVVDQVGEIARDAVSVATFGPRTVTVSDRREPANGPWANAILADRANATLEIEPGRIIPKSSAELGALAQAVAGQTVAIHLVDPARDLTGVILGGGFTGADPEGWRASFRLYVPGSPWSYVPPAPSVVVGTPQPLDILCDQDAYTYISGPGDAIPGEYRGAGGDTQLLAAGRNTNASDTARIFLRFPFDVSMCRRITEAKLYLIAYPQFANYADPRLDFLWVTQDWPEGYTATTPSKSSPIIWPGPPTDPDPAHQVLGVPTGTSPGVTQWIGYDLTALIRPWMPLELGGDGIRHYGLCVKLSREDLDYRYWAQSRESPNPGGLPAGYAPRVKFQEVT